MPVVRLTMNQGMLYAYMLQQGSRARQIDRSAFSPSTKTGAIQIPG